jgi:BMFP domain-containing protein YqiC
MLNQSKIDAFLEDVMRMMPDDVHRARAELEHNLKAALHAAFARMDLVTREEYDIQAELLSRTRALLEELEGRVQQLEDEHKQWKE